MKDEDHRLKSGVLIEDTIEEEESNDTWTWEEENNVESKDEIQEKLKHTVSVYSSCETRNWQNNLNSNEIKMISKKFN